MIIGPVRTVVAVAASLVPSLCLAWGWEGHCIIAEIAARQLDGKTKEAVQALLGGRSLAEVANWADEIKSDSSYDWAKPLHYINLPAGAVSFRFDRDCPKTGCVVSAILDNQTVLLDQRTNAARRAEALKFVIHFVGDIHQPMHAGRAVDRGGNDVKVEFFYDRTNLHVVWDELLIRRVRRPWREYADELCRRITPEKTAQWRRNMDVGEWAMESARLAASHAYPVPRDGQLGELYFDRNRPVVEERLSMAGVRLAAVLNGVFAERRAVATAPASGPAPTTREKSGAPTAGR